MLKFTLVPAAKQGVDRASCFAPRDVTTLAAETDATLADARIVLAPTPASSTFPLLSGCIYVYKTALLEYSFRDVWIQELTLYGQARRCKKGV